MRYGALSPAVKGARLLNGAFVLWRGGALSALRMSTMGCAKRPRQLRQLPSGWHPRRCRHDPRRNRSHTGTIFATSSNSCAISILPSGVVTTASVMPGMISRSARRHSAIWSLAAGMTDQHSARSPHCRWAGFCLAIYRHGAGASPTQSPCTATLRRAMSGASGCSIRRLVICVNGFDSRWYDGHSERGGIPEAADGGRTR